MRTHWSAYAAVLLGAGVLGAGLTGCEKTRVLTQIVEPQVQPEPEPQGKDTVVTSVTVAVDPPGYSGLCPATNFWLSGSIAVKETCLVAYRWERSDGTSEVLSAYLTPGSNPVAGGWYSAPEGSNWARLHVLLPEDVVSKQVNFTNRCVELAASATVQVSPAAYSGPCPSAFDFTGRISCNGAGTVYYRWEGSDGIIGIDRVMMFAGAGTEVVHLSRTLIDEGTRTIRMHILSPRDTSSNVVSYTSACQGVGVQAVVSGGPNSDPCNGIFDFYAEVMTNASTVTYQWEFSDGFISPIGTLNFSAPGTQAMTTSRQLGSDTGWARLHVLTPQDVMSNQADAVCDWCWGCGEARANGAASVRRPTGHARPK